MRWRGFLLVLALLASGGCASPGAKELKRLRVENELLREEIAIIRRNCDRYGGVKIEADDEAPADPMRQP